MNRPNGRDRAIHVGTDADWVREAAAASTVVGGSQRVASFDEAPTEAAVADATGARLVVCELSPESGVGPLVAVREALPDVPALAVVREADAVDDALAAGAADVFVRRDGVDETALLARRMDGVAASPADASLGAESTERLLDAIDDSFYALDADGALERWNDRFRESTGYDDGELEGMPALDLFAGADRDRVAEAIETVFETGSATVEAELVAKDGETTPVEYTGALVTDGDGSPRGIVGIGRDLTQRREREDRLVRLRQAVETITDAAPLTLFEVGPEGTVSTVRGETLGRRLGDGISSGDAVEETFADQPGMRRAIEAALDGESARDLVDVSDSTFEVWLRPALDEAGSVARVVGLALDVTEREERAVMLDQIQANAEEVIWISTPGKESMDFITDAYEDVWGTHPETLDDDPMSFVRAVHPDDRVEAALERQQADPDAYDETYRVVHPDGEVRWIHDKSSGVYEDGELTRVVGIATDVTVRKRRERKLRLKNRAVETAPVGIAIHETTDPGNPISYVNDAFEAITGYDGDSIAGEGVSALGGEDTDPDRVETLASAIEAGDRGSETLVLHRADGTPFWGRIAVAPVVGGDDEATHAVSFVQDVTESKEHEQEIERHLTEFGEVLADDLGAPLREARDRLNAATDDEPDEELRRAAASVETAVSLVEDLATVHSFSVEPRRLSESMRGSSAPLGSRDE
ncbi:PAS domain S-box protein [Halorubrum sp. RMP-47]|uniref:histidine kinase n=1 Tax=Halorubrum miltondacostae TaxID=3076378 RepID=A0ABD5M3X1_9EURY